MDNLRLDDLQIKNYFLYQNPNNFCFGVDAVLLANFMCKFIKKKDKVIDLCSGSGVIPILTFAKKENEDITGVEIDKEMCDMFNKSLKYNNIHNITVINEDLKTLDKSLYNSFNAISVNPPYYKVGSGEISCNDKKSIARHEIHATFDDICYISKKLLKNNSSFFLVHRTNRFEEIMLTLKNHNFETKDVQFIYPKKDKNSNLFLLRAVKNGKSGINILPALTMYNEKDEYTKEFLEYYYEDRTNK